MTCSRSKAMLIENTASGDYIMNLNAVIRPNATCVGSGSGVGKICSDYGDIRRNVGGGNGINDPTLVQRSYLSSGSRPTRLNDIPDTLANPAPVLNCVRNNNQMSDNKGNALASFHTRNFHTSQASFQEKDISNYFLFPNSWCDDYFKLNSIGGFIPTRSLESRRMSEKYAETKNSKMSNTSYGSYGC